MAEINIPISTKVPINTAFKNEHRFNDWLCTEETLTALSKKLDLSLSSPIRELYILQGQIDILCEDYNLQNHVVIESNAEIIDLDHLIRLIHYTIEINSATAVLISAKFTDKVIDFVSCFNQIMANELEIILVQAAAFKLSTGGYSCELEKLKLKPKLDAITNWSEHQDFAESINNSLTIMCDNISKLPSNQAVHTILRKFIQEDKLILDDEQLVVWWSNDMYDYYYVDTLFKTMFHQPKELYIFLADTPDQEIIKKLANLYLITKKICQITLIDTSKLNKKSNFAIYLDIYQLLADSPIYQKHKARNEFWDKFHEYYKNYSNQKVLRKPEMATGLFKYIRKTPHPNITIVALFCTRHLRFHVDVRIKHKTDVLAENLYDQLLDKKELLAQELADHVVLDWARNRLTTDNEYIIRCKWTQSKIKDVFPLIKIERASEVAEKLAIVEKVFTPYIPKNDDFVW